MAADPDSVLGVVDRAHLREAIADGDFPLLKKAGESAISNVLHHYERVVARTERLDVPIARLLREAEANLRESLRELHDELQADPDNHTASARKARALGAVSKALGRVRAAERGGSPGALQRGAVRRETQAEARARARSAIEAAWKRREER